MHRCVYTLTYMRWWCVSSSFNVKCISLYVQAYRTNNEVHFIRCLGLLIVGFVFMVNGTTRANGTRIKCIITLKWLIVIS